MQAAWKAMEREPEITASELLPAVQEKRTWHFSTLKTMLDRLVKKGYLSSRIRGNTCFYQSTIPRDQAVRGAIGSFVDNVLDGTFGPLVAYLADRRRLSKRQIAELERMLDGSEER